MTRGSFKIINITKLKLAARVFGLLLGFWLFKNINSLAYECKCNIGFVDAVKTKEPDLSLISFLLKLADKGNKLQGNKVQVCL